MNKFIAICLTALFAVASALEAPEKSLAKHLLDKYQQLGGAVGRPVTRPTDTVKVSVSTALQGVVKTEKNSITIATSIQLKWNDPFLAWSPSDYAGIESIVLPANAIWKPDFINHNDVHHKLADQAAGMDVANLVVSSQGVVTWTPRANFQSMCSYRYVEEEDDDQMVCSFEFGSATYDVKQVDFDFESKAADFNMAAYQQSALVEVVEQWAEKTVEPGVHDVNKQHSVLSYHLTVRKAPKDAFYSMAAPCKAGSKHCTANSKNKVNASKA